MAARWLVALGALLLLAPAAAAADARPGADEAAWRSECGACHLAYPAALLTADAWRRLMAGLPRHFGSDASVEAATAEAITRYLVADAGPGSAGDSEEPPRITATDWFVRKHGGAMRLWRKGKIKSLSDCAVCHKGPEIEHMSGR